MKEDSFEFLITYGWAILVIMLAISALVYFGSSLYDTSGTFRLSNGEIVKCNTVLGGYCGLSLRDCDNGVEYKCLTNVQKIGD